jgi:hypothetical protein
LKGQRGNPAGRPKGSFNFAGLLARQMWPPMRDFSCYFPVPPCYFRPVSRLRVDFIPDLHFARPHLQGFTGTSHDGERRRKSSVLHPNRPKTETLGRCASAGIALCPCPECARCARARPHPYQFHPYHDQRARQWTARAPERKRRRKGN